MRSRQHSGSARVLYNRYRDATNLDDRLHKMSSKPVWGRDSEAANDAQDAVAARQYLVEGKQRSIALLQLAICALEYEISKFEPPKAVVANSESIARRRDLSKVFVVHGHEGAREAVARFLGRLEIRPVILHKQANRTAQ